LEKEFAFGLKFGLILLEDNKLKTELKIAFVSLFLFISGSLFAAQPINDEVWDQNMDKLAIALAMNEAQKQAVSSILLNSIKNRGLVLSKYGISLESNSRVYLDVHDKLALRKEMKVIERSVKKSLSEVLDKKQLKFFIDYSENERSQFKSRLEEKIS
jgi:hypothetical protein